MRKRKVVLATGNVHKLDEIKDILKDLPIEILSKDRVGLKDIDVVEDGKTLEENAIKKVKAIGERVEKSIVIADDSGLFVDFLNGEPGIYSARYAGENSTDEDNNIKLLDRLKGVAKEKRTAAFKAVIVLMMEDGNIVTVTGECKGSIGFEPVGDRGFGYDPLFVAEGYDKSFSELGEEVKNQISHRAKALEKLKEKLIKILEDDTDEDICGK